MFEAGFDAEFERTFFGAMPGNGSGSGSFKQKVGDTTALYKRLGEALSYF